MEGNSQPGYAIEFAEAAEPVGRVPAFLNGFGVWNVVILGLMLANFGYPIAQFFFSKTYGSVGWGY
jgi:cytochrome c oxidase subunit 1